MIKSIKRDLDDANSREDTSKKPLGVLDKPKEEKSNQQKLF